MKLLSAFQKQISEMGDLRYVWLTSFGINIEFIETYLLPAALKMEQPKLRMDFEHIQLALAASGMDFRVFCDKRLMAENQNKRTAVPVHGVTPFQNDEWFSKDSLFHPKVIYLEDVHGKKIIGAGSANLTLDGWGRNQEAFVFFEVTTKEQYQSVKTFFNNVTELVGIEERLPAGRGLPEHKSNWDFVHSFQDSTFLKQFFDGVRASDLLVWSPYFPKDLVGFVRRLKTIHEVEDLVVHLVPDRVEGKYIRTPWTTELQKVVNKGEIKFYENPTSRHEKIEMTHAKVWKLGNKLAIGSWNFTGRGSNCTLVPDGERSTEINIEAGFIIANSNSWQESAGKPIKTEAGQFANQELLEKESLKVPEALPFDIWVYFDWYSQQYSFGGHWLIGNISDQYTIRVPALEKVLPLIWRTRNKDLVVEPRYVNDPSELLLERRFQIIFNGEVISHGLIIESSPEFRRPQAYESLSDLLDGFVIGGEAGSTDDVPFCPVIKDAIKLFDNNFQEDVEIVDNYSSDTNISYFRLFQAVEVYADKLEKLNSEKELDNWVFNFPGCLAELLNKTKEKITNDEPNIFNWFLAQEVRTLCLKAKKRKRHLDSSVPKQRWDELDLQLPELPAAIKADYVEMIQTECSYVS